MPEQFGTHNGRNNDRITGSAEHRNELNGEQSQSMMDLPSAVYTEGLDLFIIDYFSVWSQYNTEWTE